MNKTDQVISTLTDEFMFDGLGIMKLTREAAQCIVELLKEQQPKKAKWKAVHYIRKEGTKTFKKCTCCGYTCNGWDIETGIAYDYCPNCGAEMQNGNTNRDSK